MSKSISRKDFLKNMAKGMAGCSLGALSTTACAQWLNSSPQFPCRMLGPSRELGHKLRDGLVSPSNSTALGAKEVVIVGGGMAGLSAGWWLKRNGFSDFVILELEKKVGGNSVSGANQYSAYPWGAHYVPIANQESEYVRLLFEELNVIARFDKSGLPFYDELYLCHEPQERLFKDGRFQEGLVPKRGLQKEEEQEIGRFFDRMINFRNSTGSDGKLAFAIPLDLSSQDPEFIKLDKISMADWLHENHFRSKPLAWYVNYCCRDDYGSLSQNVSAWAGVHYFAGRRGHAANAELNSVVTWPEGNGFIVNKLKDKLRDHITAKALVTQIDDQDQIMEDGVGKDSAKLDRRAKTTYLRSDTNKFYSIESDFVIFAAPRFVAMHVLKQLEKPPIDHHDLSYAPWMVANVSLKRIPDATGVPLAWDNVSFYSNSLGYVCATHQEITTREKPTVITYYYPLSDSDPVTSRQQLYDASSQIWSQRIVKDLESMHPGIGNEIISMDLWPWGHGMIRPSVGFIWGGVRQKMKDTLGNIVFAHSDMSGMSNFEEAQYHGVEAAKHVLKVTSGRQRNGA